MNGADVGKGPSVGEQLIAAGWLQGALFSLSSAYVCCNAPADPGAEQSIEVKKRKLRSGEKLVVVSQTCDILASQQHEPFVLTYVCRVEKNQKFVDSVEQNSARYFVVDPHSRLVAHAKYPVVVAKEVLLQVAPEPWPSGKERFDRFVRWLARRFDRPAVPDQLVAVFQSPIERVLRELSENQPEVRAAFSRAVHEVRVNLPGDEEPPYYLQLVLMARQPALTSEESDAIDVVMSVIQAALDPGIVKLDPQPWIVTEHEISWGAYRRTRPLYLEYLTYRGDDAEGAEPFPRA